MLSPLWLHDITKGNRSVFVVAVCHCFVKLLCCSTTVLLYYCAQQNNTNLRKAFFFNNNCNNSKVISTEVKCEHNGFLLDGNNDKVEALEASNAVMLGRNREVIISRTYRQRAKSVCKRSTESSAQLKYQ